MPDEIAVSRQICEASVTQREFTFAYRNLRLTSPVRPLRRLLAERQAAVTPREMRERAAHCLERATAEDDPQVAADLKLTADQLLLSADELEELRSGEKL